MNDIIFYVSIGIFWTQFVLLWIENDNLKLKVMGHEDYIEQLKTRLGNKK